MAKKAILKADYFWTLIHAENADFAFLSAEISVYTCTWRTPA